MSGPDQNLALRDPLFVILIGSNGTGKTYTILEFLEAVQGGGLIIDPEGMEEDWTTQFPEIQESQIKEITDQRCLVIHPTDETYTAIQTEFSGRFLVVDDCRYYIGKRGEANFHKITQRRRQIAIDIFAACHGLTEVPDVFWTFATHAIVFKTTDSYRKRKYDMNQDIFNKLESAILEVNKSDDLHARKLVILR